MTTAGLGRSAYIDIAGYQQAPHGQETASLLGLSTTTAGASQPAGTTSLQVVSSSGNASWVAGSAWILDGPTSEIVTITGSADGTHLTLAAPGTQFAHAPGVSVSQAGVNGCLAATILRACGWIENYCQQGASSGSAGDRSLYALARTERWPMPTVRAYLDRDRVLAIMPGHFPVQSVSAVAIELGQGQSLSLDATQAELPTTGRVVEFPYLLQSGITLGAQLFLDTPGYGGLSRSLRQWATITYTGGPCAVGNVPYDIEQAAVWVVSDLLSQRQNPTGAAEISLGKRRLVQRQRGDVVGDSILLLRAHDALEPYRAGLWA